MNRKIIGFLKKIVFSRIFEAVDKIREFTSNEIINRIVPDVGTVTRLMNEAKTAKAVITGGIYFKLNVIIGAKELSY